MSRATPVSITGPVLRWAIRESGFSEAEIAKRLEVPSDRVREWEEEKAKPTKTQFSQLVSLLKRPSAVFFLPASPEIKSYANFRRAPGREEEPTSPDEARWIRVATRLQEATSLVLERLDRPPIDLPHIQRGIEPEPTADSERQRIGIPVSAQTQWPTVSSAFKEWRTVLENHGVLVFQLRLGRSSCRGFSLWDDRAPLIAVNTSFNFQARIYTLFHEYAHLLTRTNSVCVDFPEFPADRSGDFWERWCEEFSASFLLPRADFLEYLQRMREGMSVIGFDLVNRLANKFRISLRAVALRLVELGQADFDLYREVDRRARVSEQERRGGGGRPQRRHERRLEEFGHRVPSILLEGARQSIIDTHDVLDYLDLSTGNLDALRKTLVG
jgi:Zn-dependent peptidase ImmA (M78 family)